jgi:hypothetical protein
MADFLGSTCANFCFSVGKSTVLNALLGDKFSEVSLRRTTAGVNFFRICHMNNEEETKKREGEDKESSSDQSNGMAWYVVEDKPTRPAASTNEETREDNASL